MGFPVLSVGALGPILSTATGAVFGNDSPPLRTPNKSEHSFVTGCVCLALSVQGWAAAHSLPGAGRGSPPTVAGGPDQGTAGAGSPKPWGAAWLGLHRALHRASDTWNGPELQGRSSLPYCLAKINFRILVHEPWVRMLHLL